MLKLVTALAAWPDGDFAGALARELARQADALPLQDGLRYGSHALYDDLKTNLISCRQRPDRLLIRVGVFYKSVVAGCSCADDPTPVDSVTEYCELDISLDFRTAVAHAALREA